MLSRTRCECIFSAFHQNDVLLCMFNCYSFLECRKFLVKLYELKFFSFPFRHLKFFSFFSFLLLPNTERKKISRTINTFTCGWNGGCVCEADVKRRDVNFFSFFCRKMIFWSRSCVLYCYLLLLKAKKNVNEKKTNENSRKNYFFMSHNLSFHCMRLFFSDAWKYFSSFSLSSYHI